MANNALIIADILHKNMLDYLFISSGDFNISIFGSSFEILGNIVTEL